MAKCEVCQNDYDVVLEVRYRGEEHVFDSFECAIHGLAPACEQCGCRIVGHGVQADDQLYCCASCAAAAGVTGLHDGV